MIDRSLNYGRHHIDRFLREADKPSLIVDLGAGQGYDLAIARNIWPQAKLVGVESWSPYVKALENKRIGVLPLNIERDALPFPDESVDIFVANQVLEHCKEIFWIFHEVTRTLRVGGTFIVGVPNLAALHNRLLLAFGRQPSPIKTASAHVRGYTKTDIEYFLNSCFPGGYSVDGFGGSNFYPFPPVIAKPLARLFPTFAWGIFLKLRKVREYEGQFLDFPVAQRLETNFWLGKDE